MSDNKIPGIWKHENGLWFACIGEGTGNYEASTGHKNSLGAAVARYNMEVERGKPKDITKKYIIDYINNGGINE